MCPKTKKYITSRYIRSLLGIAGVTIRHRCVQNREKTRLSSDWKLDPRQDVAVPACCSPGTGDGRLPSGPTSDREETWLPRSDAAGVRVRCCCCRWHLVRPLPLITTPPDSRSVAVFFSRLASGVRARRPAMPRMRAVRRRAVPGTIAGTTGSRLLADVR